MNKKSDLKEDPKVKAIARFELAQKRLANELEPLQHTIEEYNASLEEANAAVRGLGVSIGDFKIAREFDEYDADKLYELVGRTRFLELGGTERTVRELGIDKTKFRSFLAAGKVPKEIVSQIHTRQRQYSTPKPLKLA